jgi:hypothetical protein
MCHIHLSISIMSNHAKQSYLNIVSLVCLSLLYYRPVAQTATRSVQGVWNPAFNHVDVTQQIKQKVKPYESLLGVVVKTTQQSTTQ